MEILKKIQQLEKKKLMRQYNAIEFEKSKPHEHDPKDVATFLLSPVVSTSQTIAALTGLNIEENLAALAGELSNQLLGVKDGDISKLEQILFSQSVVLNVAFNNFLRKANACTSNAALMSHSPEIFNNFAALALKCQDQSRKALATLSEIKNPRKPTQFIKSYVDKQLNQLRVDSKESQHQLEGRNDAPLDFRGKGKAASDDTTMEALEEQYRTKESIRKRKGSPKRAEARV
jgi:hypothetical protein